MAVLLNFIILILFVNWFLKNLQKPNPFPIIGIALIFLVTLLVIFILALVVQNGYLDGIQTLLFSGGSILLFWIISTVSILIHHNKQKTQHKIFFDWIQTIPLIIVPIWLWFWISTANFKIGG